MRFSWGLGGPWRQSVSLEQERFPLDARAAVAYRTDWSLSPAIMAGGEAASDGSLLLKGRYGLGAHAIDAFWRQDGPHHTRQLGGLLSLGIWRGLVAGAGARLAPAEHERSYLGGLSLPLKRLGTVSIQQVHTTRGELSQAATGVSASLPIGPFRFFERVQWLDSGASRAHAGARATGQQVQSVATYSPTPRVHLVYQSATQWFAGGSATRWDEIQTSVQVSRSTWIYTTHAVPRLADAERFRIRVARTLGRASSLSIEYGQLPAFQPVHAFHADRPRLLLMARHGFGLRTPARGGVISGQVLDELDRPVKGAAVRLGPYLTAVEDDGTFRFEKVPAGTYEIALDRSHLPAHYGESTDAQTVVVSARPMRAVQLRAMSLHTVHGRVYVDRNRNGTLDRGEGAAGIVIRLGDLATATDADGRYTFQTVQPGTHVVRVDRSRLAADLEPASPAEQDVHLLPDGTGGGADFVLRPRQKPIRMQEDM